MALSSPALAVLVIDDDPALRASLTRALRGLGCEVADAADGDEGIAKLGSRPFSLVITDLVMPGADGFAVLRAVRQRAPHTTTVMLTAQGGISECVAAIKAGADDFLVKPFHRADIERLVERARAASAPGAADEPRHASAGTGCILGSSAAMAAVLDTIARVAPTDATVLLMGETGTGKEVVARLIHGSSPRAGSPFVAINCGAIPESLMESELFGHARGAFTGAHERAIGRFVQAHGGTLFLDEVGELPAPVQVKLLRVLQEREVTPLGGKPQAIDVRVVAATLRDLEAMVREGRFRADLYYRLNVVPILVPALRERPDDVPALAAHFLDKAARGLGRNLSFTREAVEALQRHLWPGNVRELENVVARTAIMARADAIDVADLPDALREGAPAPAAPGAPEDLPGDLPGAMARLEADMIRRALRRSGGNKSEAARLLGINRTTLVEKLKRLRLE